MLICNTDRGRLAPIRGVPWVVLIVLGVAGHVDGAARADEVRPLHLRHRRQRRGRPPRRRQPGRDPHRGASRSRSFTAGIAGIVYASRLRSVSTALDGGTLVLYAVAAAVIGGTSLFGGRGKAMHAVLGGLVIAAIDNGMGLQGYSAASKYIVTAIVLLAAVTIDAIARRGGARCRGMTGPAGHSVMSTHRSSSARPGPPNEPPKPADAPADAALAARALDRRAACDPAVAVRAGPVAEDEVAVVHGLEDKGRREPGEERDDRPRRQGDRRARRQEQDPLRVAHPDGVERQHARRGPRAA